MNEVDYVLEVIREFRLCTIEQLGEIKEEWTLKLKADAVSEEIITLCQKIINFVISEKIEIEAN